MENKKDLIYFFGNFTFICLTLLGLFFVYNGVVAGFLEIKVSGRAILLIYGVASIALGLIGLGYIREWWR